MAEPGKSSNVYTVLCVIATVALVAAIAFVWTKSAELTGSANPFQIVSTQ